MVKFLEMLGFGKAKLGIKEAGIGILARNNSFDVGGIDNEEQNISIQQRYNNSYNNFPIIAGAIDITAEQAIQNFYFEGSDKEKCEKFADDHNLGVVFYSLCKHLLRNGNCWIEFPKKGEEIIEVKMIDPVTMTTWRMKTGEVIGHSQNIDLSKRVLWGTTGDATKDAQFSKRAKLSDIAHFTFNKFGGDKYGNSIIHPVLPLLNIKDRIESDLMVIVRRYAAPIIHAQVGDETHLPSNDDITTVKNGLKDIYADTEYVTNFLTKMSVIGFEGKALRLGEITKHIDSQIIAGLQVPAVLLGLGEGTNKAVAEVQLRSFGRHIKSIQRQMKTQFEDMVIVKQMGLNPDNKLIWGEAEEREYEIGMDIIRGLVTDGLITPQKANDLLPPKFHEELPEEMKTKNPMMAQAERSQAQNQKPFQKGADKIKDNPTDPTLKQKEPGQRRTKTDKEIPVK